MVQLITFKLKSADAHQHHHHQHEHLRLGAYLPDQKQVIDLHAADPSLPKDMRSLLEAGDAAIAKVKAIVASGAHRIPADTVQIKAPIYNPEKIICVGLNYKDHAEECKATIPPEPVLFSKFNSAIIGPGETIVFPASVKEPDWEVELVVVIGKTAKNVSEADALKYVFGYCTGHDVSARDWQLKKAGGQWMVGKTFDTFAPLGPAIVSADEVGDPHQLGLRCLVNGVAMQNSNTSHLIFRVPRLVEYISSVMTLRPGDLIFTGTPAGVGTGRKPQVWFKNGDVAVVEIDKLGRLENPVVVQSS